VTDIQGLLNNNNKWEDGGQNKGKYSFNQFLVQTKTLATQL
jgi:hypothetical protein